MTALPSLHICRKANTSFTNINFYDVLDVGGTSVGANIREAHYAHGTADFIAKLQIALKESNETGYWPELLFKTNYIDEITYKSLSSQCTSIRVMLISSINTAKQNTDKSN